MLGIVLVEDSYVLRTLPIFIKVVVFNKGFNYAAGMYLLYVLHTKIVDNKNKTDGAPGVYLEAGVNLALLMANLIETLFE